MTVIKLETFIVIMAVAPVELIRFVYITLKY